MTTNGTSTSSPVSSSAMISNMSEFACAGIGFFETDSTRAESLWGT